MKQVAQFALLWVVISFFLSFNVLAENDRAVSRAVMLSALESLPAERNIGRDFRGIPILCGSNDSGKVVSVLQVSPQGKPPPPPPPTVLPAGMRSWECVPSVIRADA